MGRIHQLAINDEGFIFDPTTGQSFTTNATGLLLLRTFKEGKTSPEAVRALVEKYDIQTQEAEHDILDFISQLKSYRLL